MDATVEKQETNRRSRVSGIDRALQVLDVLQSSGAPSGAYAIARAIGAPLSTVYAIVDDLVERRMLQRRADGSVWLGPRLYHYGLAYAQSLDFLDVATHEMHDLCREVGETVQICGRDGDHMVVLAMADGPGHFRVSSRVGTRVPLNWTASGRLLVGHLPGPEIEALFARIARASPTGRAETDPSALAGASAQALRERLCIQMSESDFAVACVASPIRDGSGECQATVSIVLPEHKVVQDGDRYTQAVKDAAARIETRLGWR
ncbi:IclR family transcriptional regulator [Alsobacter sp. SYSU M60028]|uniref:IclR family transcriptional regulator n=1 Tax=Alsobacter ponti TaxID=2962936 RepID=A0ABT1LDT5_9HYPH|nr:IclR family transcriptional regulator [Alsobacter ponti]MCP8938403.1 IclR family transcriptional regulator [Alsobacter ponti]